MKLAVAVVVVLVAWPARHAAAEGVLILLALRMPIGIAMLLVDTPGRGSSMYVKNIPTRPDYEVPGRACFDYLASRPEVDPDRLALMGISMAGYYAPRVAAFEDRIKAFVGWCGCYSILDDLYDFCEHLQPTVQRLLGGVSHEEAREQLAAFTMAGIAKNITCPTYITHGSTDTLMSIDGARRLFDEIGAEDKTFRLFDDEEAGGTRHCSHDRWVDNVPEMLDWLEARLQGAIRAPRPSRRAFGPPQGERKR